MNKDQIEGNWQQFKGKIKETYGKLTDDDIALFNGKRDQFFGKIQEKYGEAREAAEKRISEYETSTGYRYNEAKKSNVA
jgi:uncharacterized protein YjbJ (UPF0337 family)